VTGSLLAWAGEGRAPPSADEIRARARLAMRNRDWSQAWQCWNDLRARIPDDAEALAACGDALRELGRLDEAEAMLGAAAERFTDRNIALAYARIASARQDWGAAALRWRSLIALFPEHFWGYLRGSAALRAIGRSDEADGMLSELEARLAATPAAKLTEESRRELTLEIAKARSDWPTVRQAAQQLLAVQAEPSAPVLLALARACWQMKDFEGADAAAERALARDATLIEALLIRTWVASGRGDAEQALWGYRCLLRLSPFNVRWTLPLIQLLNYLGRVKEAVAELDALRRHRPDDQAVRLFALQFGPTQPRVWVRRAECRSPPGPARAEEEDLEALFENAPADHALSRPVMEGDPDRDVIIAAAQGAPAAVLVFTGAADAVSMPLPIFDRYVAALGITAIYLKDFHRLQYLAGIESLGRDYWGTIEALRRRMRELRVTRVCAIGNCNGGFAAIRYGIELGADIVLAFNPPTHVAARSASWRLFTEKHLRARFAPEMLDLRAFLEARRYNTEIELFYEEGDPKGRAQALHLSGVAGVGLHADPGTGQDRLLRRLARQPGFLNRLAGLLRVPDVTGGRLGGSALR
jgi:tetratricopeptide (TPR) repeat protein